MKEADVPEMLLNLPCAEFPPTPKVKGGPLSARRIAIISTAGLMHRHDRPFSVGATDYRILDSESDEDILISHISTNFDRSGFVQDYNIAFPLDRLRTLAENGEIGSVARYHYSFMGATEPEKLQTVAGQLARVLHSDQVDGLLLVPI